MDDPKKAYRIAIALPALVCLTAAADATEWPLGTYHNRAWERITLPGASCGNGTEYAYFYSPPEPGGEYRLVVHHQGGGSTWRTTSGGLETGLNTLRAVKSKLNVEQTIDADEGLFMDRPENDTYIGPAHWAFIPYCTQDEHFGRRTDPEVYDFTNLPENTVRADVEALLDQGWTEAEIEADFPGIDIQGIYEDPPGTHHVNLLTITITHRGTLNVEAATADLLSRILAAYPDFLDRADILVSGGSAGGKGAWYNFWRWGDLVWGRPGTRLTLAPLSGSPTERFWSNAARDLVFVQQFADEIDFRTSFWQAERPCEIAGGAHVPSGSDDCDDAFTLLDHYRTQRYPGHDLEFLPEVNKEDAVAIHNLGGSNAAALLFCKTVHRAAQYLGRIPSTHPFAPWMFFREPPPPDAPIQREHTPNRATILARVQEAGGAGAAQGFSLLAYINAVASRTLVSSVLQLEYLAHVVEDVNDPKAAENPIPYTDHMAQFGTCNVPRPVPVAAKKLRVRDDQTRPKRRQLKLRVSTRRAEDLNRVVLPAPGSDGDPTLGGGVVIVYDSAGGSDATTISLPASGWELLGAPGNPRGYRYRATSESDPARKVVVKKDSITVDLGGASFGYGLSDAPQGRVATRLELGAQVVWCTDAPAKDAAHDTTELFLGLRDAPPPERCVPVPAP